MKRWRKVVMGACCGLGLLSLILIAWARANTDGVEGLYSRGFYPVWAGILSALTSRLPFSLAELLLIGAAAAALGFLGFYIRRMIKKEKTESRLGITGRYLMYMVSAASLLLFFFTLGGGLNYYRYSFTHYSGLEVHDSEVSQLKDLCAELAERASALRVGLPEDGSGVFTFADPSPRALAKTAREHYNALIRQNPQWEELLRLGANTTSKGVFFSEAMSYMQIVGFYFPYTMEANVNMHTSDIDIPFAICHELSHINGFMREDEANYLAYLVCMAGESAEFQYSGAVMALIHATNALYGKNTEMYDEVMSSLSDGVLRDLNADAKYYSDHTSSFGDFSNSVNDVYLRINDQTDGVASYGRMVDLMLADYRQRSGLA